MLTAMPSPKGTNEARMFLPPTWPRVSNPVAAYDSARGLGRGQDESSLTAEHVINVLQFLCSRLPAEERGKVREFARANEALAGDEPPDFPGQPRLGGEQVPLRAAADALPRTARMRAAQALLRQSAAASASFAKMFPEAARVGVLR